MERINRNEAIKMLLGINRKELSKLSKDQLIAHLNDAYEYRILKEYDFELSNRLYYATKNKFLVAYADSVEIPIKKENES